MIPSGRICEHCGGPLAVRHPSRVMTGITVPCDHTDYPNNCAVCLKTATGERKFSNTLIAVKSCAADITAGHNQCIRETWGKHFKTADGVVLRFFPGRGNISLVADEIQVNAPDDYLGLPRKTCAILRYAEAARFDFIFLCDTDTFVRPELLLASGFENCDLTGYFGNRIPGQREGDGFYAWPSGGAGYWLSMQAVSYIAHNQLFEDWAEDRMVGQLLGPHIAMGKLTAVNNRLYGASVERDDLITAHYESRILKRQYDPAWMRALYKRFYPETTCTSKITKPSLSGSPSLPRNAGS